MIETLRWTRARGYYLLERHLARLARSAQHFGFRCDRAVVRVDLKRAADAFESGAYRVRLLLDENGATTVTATPITLPGPDDVMRFVISDQAVDSSNPFYFHKTTNRQLYDEELARLQVQSDCDEVVFVNERGELTEGSRTNLFIEHDGILLTPPLSCGLLDGTLRRELLESGERTVREEVLRPRDLDLAEAVYLGNSVRGLMRAERIDLTGLPLPVASEQSAMPS